MQNFLQVSIVNLVCFGSRWLGNESSAPISIMLIAASPWYRQAPVRQMIEVVDLISCEGFAPHLSPVHIGRFPVVACLP